MTPTLNDHMIALGANVEVFGRRFREAGEAIVSFVRTARRAIAPSVRSLSRERRAEYWALRKVGMYPLDALAMMKQRSTSARTAVTARWVQRRNEKEMKQYAEDVAYIETQSEARARGLAKRFGLTQPLARQPRS